MDSHDALTPPAQPVDDWQLVSAAELAELLSVSRTTLRRLISKPGFPPRLKLPTGSVRWRLSDITAYLEGLQPHRLQTAAPAHPETVRLHPNVAMTAAKRAALRNQQGQVS